MYDISSCYNVAKCIDFYLGQLRFNMTSTGNAECFKKELYNGIPNVTVWRVLQKHLRLEAYNYSSLKVFQR
jgi:hypothetical protein